MDRRKILKISLVVLPITLGLLGVLFAVLKPTLEIRISPANARVILDGVEMPLITTPQASGGNHHIIVYSDNYRKEEKDIKAGVLGKKVISIKLAELGKPPLELPYEDVRSLFTISSTYNEFGEPSYLIVYGNAAAKAKAIEWLESKNIDIAKQNVTFEEDGG